MDPAKRICLKNLPIGCTKRDIAEMVRSRTGSQVHSIDLGLNADGIGRRYAHLSCEGAKKVLEVLSGGVVMDGETVYAYPAKPHYSFVYAEARRKREREEEEEQASLQQYWEERRRRFLEKTGRELPKKPPRPFDATKQRYAVVASEIAKRLREEHAARHPRRVNVGHRHNESQRQIAHMPVNLQDVRNAAEGVAADNSAACGSTGIPATPIGIHRNKGPLVERGSRSRVKHNTVRVKTKNVKAAASPAPPPEQSKPSKEERKLSGLQAKLLALKEKLKKK